MDIGTIAISGVVRGFIFGFRQILNIFKWIFKCLCPHGLYLKFTKIKRYRELFIAEIENKLVFSGKIREGVNNYSIMKDDFCKNGLCKISSYFDFPLLNNDYDHNITSVDLEKIKEQIRKGLHDEKILNYFKTKAER